MTTIDYSQPAAALNALVRSTRLLMAALDIAEMSASVDTDRAVQHARKAVQIDMEGIWNARIQRELAQRGRSDDIRPPRGVGGSTDDYGMGSGVRP